MLKSSVTYKGNMGIAPRDQTVKALCNYYQEQIDPPAKKPTQKWFGKQMRLTVRGESNNKHLEYIPLSFWERVKAVFSKDTSKNAILKFLNSSSQSLVESTEIENLKTIIEENDFSKLKINSVFKKQILSITQQIVDVSEGIKKRILQASLENDEIPGVDSDTKPEEENEVESITEEIKQESDIKAEVEAEDTESVTEEFEPIPTTSKKEEETIIEREEGDTESFTEEFEQVPTTDKEEIVTDIDIEEENTESFTEEIEQVSSKRAEDVENRIDIETEDTESVTEELVAKEITLSQEIQSYNQFDRLVSSLQEQLSRTFLGKKIEIYDLILARNEEGLSFVHKDSLIGKKLIIESAWQQRNAATADANQAFKILGETYESFQKATENLTPHEYESRYQQFETYQNLLDKQLDDLVYHIIPKSVNDIADVNAILLKAGDGFDEKNKNLPRKEYKAKLEEFEQQEKFIRFNLHKLCKAPDVTSASRLLNVAFKKNMESGSLREKQFHKMYDGLFPEEASNSLDVQNFIEFHLKNYPQEQIDIEGLYRIQLNRDIISQIRNDFGNYHGLCERVKALDDPTSELVVQLSNGGATFCIPGGCLDHYVTYEIKRENDTYFFLVHNRGEGCDDEDLHGDLTITSQEGIAYKRTTVCIQVDPKQLTEEFFQDILEAANALNMDLAYTHIVNHLVQDEEKIIISREEEKLIENLHNKQLCLNELEKPVPQVPVAQIQDKLREIEAEIKTLETALIDKDIFHSRQMYATCQESNRTQPEKSMCDKLTRSKLKLFTIEKRMQAVEETEFKNKRIQNELLEMARIRVERLKAKIEHQAQKRML